MASSALRKEERVGLGVALAAHVALLLVLVVRPPSGPAVPVPERMVVTLSDDVGLTSTSPEPFAESAPDVAPVLGEPAPPQAVPMVRPEPPAPRVDPVPPQRPAPAPRAAAPRPSPPKAEPKPAPPSREPARRSPERSAPAPKAKPPEKTGGSRLGDDFLKGVQGAQSTGRSQNSPAAEIGPAVRSSLASAISRQLKPHWAAPQGADAEQLITVLAWSLNKDGSLAGPVRVVSQDGINDANRPQASRHAEQAVRAVELAAPFDLPSEYYDAWKRVSSFRFDKRLAQ